MFVVLFSNRFLQFSFILFLVAFFYRFTVAFCWQLHSDLTFRSALLFILYLSPHPLYPFHFWIFSFDFGFLVLIFDFLVFDLHEKNVHQAAPLAQTLQLSLGPYRSAGQLFFLFVILLS